jgi:GIY-YIG catalytic domain
MTAMDDAPVPSPRTGHEVIQDYLRTLDGSPGVYRMLNAASEVLYVGKARNLKARVSNYARPSGHSGRIARMIHETASMMFLTTRTELEALLLEHPDLGRTPLSADQETPRQEVRKGRLLRPLRLSRRRQPHAEPAAEGLPSAQLQRLHV